MKEGVDASKSRRFPWMMFLPLAGASGSLRGVAGAGERIEESSVKSASDSVNSMPEITSRRR